MNCRYCSTELPEGALFCGECGRAVSSKRPAAEPELPAGPVAPAAEPVVADPAIAVAGDRCAQCGAELAPTDIFCGECGFVRQSIAARRRPGDTVELDPFPWGVSPERPQGAPESAPPPLVLPSPGSAQAPVAAEDDTDETRIVDRTAKGERFVLQFSTGESVSVRGTGLVGRNPVAEPGEYFDNFVTIVDPGKSVSKTHLEFGQDGGAFWISDRYSGNGTVVREPDRPARRADAGKRYRVVRGTRIDMGEQFFVVS